MLSSTSHAAYDPPTRIPLHGPSPGDEGKETSMICPADRDATRHRMHVCRTASPEAPLVHFDRGGRIPEAAAIASAGTPTGRL